MLAHETLFRWSMLAEALGVVVFIGLSLALYRLFESVDRHRARQLAALVLVSAALSLVTLVFNASALLVFRGGDAFSGFDMHTREAVGMLLIRMHEQAKGINQMLWHCNRHTFCYWLAMAGATLKEIQEAEGHKSITMSVRYAHLFDAHKQSVVERIASRPDIPSRRSPDADWEMRRAA